MDFADWLLTRALPVVVALLFLALILGLLSAGVAAVAVLSGRILGCAP